MYGWRGKIGLLVPSLNCTMEPEFNRMAPEGVSVFATRLRFERGLPENMKALSEGLDEAVDLLGTAEVTGIVYGCTSGSLIKGLGSDLDIIEQIERSSQIVATTTATAAVEAFKALGAKSLAVATPYVEEVNVSEKAFFEGHGFKVTHIAGLGFTTGADLHRVPPEMAYDFARKVDRPEADCLFISCTDFATIRVLDLLERDLKKPVVSSNTASLWAILKKMGIHSDIKGYGSIFNCP